MKLLFLVPARGGSSGLPGKNLALVGGIPLVGRAVRVARQAGRLLAGEHRVVCTTDDTAIAAAAREWGAEIPFLRPAELATSHASSIDAVRHALSALVEEFEAVVLLQPTSPLTEAEDVCGAVSLFRETGLPVVSVCRVEHPLEWHQRMDASGRLSPILSSGDIQQRQLAAPACRPNGAVFVASPAQLRSDSVWSTGARGFLMPAARSIDVDTAADLGAVRGLLAARPTPQLEIAGRKIGAGHPCFVVAEAGVNHDGDPAEAHRLIDAAAEIGADAVKFQTWRTERICRRGAPKADYQRAQDGDQDDQFAMLKRLELPESVWPELKRHADERGIVLLSTPDEIGSAELLVSLGVPALKVGSGELDNLPYLAELGAFGLPVLLSTGMGTLVEVDAALAALRASGPGPVMLLHGVSAYPAPCHDMNVRAIATLREAFGVPVGLSDHCPGPAAVLAAVGLGLPLWEKHLTRDRGRPGPDHAASLDPDGFARQIALLREAESALGDGRKEPRPSERSTLAVVRKRLHAARELPAGHRLSAADLEALRAERGLPVGRWHSVLGRPLTRPLRAGQPLDEGDIACD